MVLTFGHLRGALRCSFGAGEPAVLALPRRARLCAHDDGVQPKGKNHLFLLSLLVCPQLTHDDGVQPKGNEPSLPLSLSLFALN